MRSVDSGRLDQTLTRRINEDELDIVTAVLAMMPPAWENDTTLSPSVRAMLEYFSLYEEKNDGPAALIFNDGIRVGARLDRLVYALYARLKPPIIWRLCRSRANRLPS